MVSVMKNSTPEMEDLIERHNNFLDTLMKNEEERMKKFCELIAALDALKNKTSCETEQRNVVKAYKLRNGVYEIQPYVIDLIERSTEDRTDFDHSERDNVYLPIVCQNSDVTILHPWRSSLSADIPNDTSDPIVKCEEVDIEEDQTDQHLLPSAQCLSSLQSHSNQSGNSSKSVYKEEVVILEGQQNSNQNSDNVPFCKEECVDLNEVCSQSSTSCLVNCDSNQSIFQVPICMRESRSASKRPYSADNCDFSPNDLLDSGSSVCLNDSKIPDCDDSNVSFENASDDDLMVLDDDNVSDDEGEGPCIKQSAPKKLQLSSDVRISTSGASNSSTPTGVDDVVFVEVDDPSDLMPMLPAKPCVNALDDGNQPQEQHSSSKDEQAMPDGLHNVEEDQYFCYDCGQRFTKKVLIFRHLESIHSNDGQQRNASTKSNDGLCKIRKPCNQKNYSYDYQHVHAGQKIFQCHVCEKIFGCKSYLERHELVHSKLKPHICEVCNKAFKRRYHLNAHSFVHIDQKLYSCSFCEKAFKRRVDLKLHLLVHSAEKPHVCEVCKKTFKRKTDLNAHNLVHLDQKPYVCDLCQKAFKRRAHLKEHLLLHSDEKPYSCNICKKRFRRHYYLKVHNLVHIKQRAKVENNAMLCNNEDLV